MKDLKLQAEAAAPLCPFSDVVDLYLFSFRILSSAQKLTDCLKSKCLPGKAEEAFCLSLHVSGAFRLAF